MYKSREDSFFMSEVLLDYFKNKNVKEKKVLDLGTGSGIQAEALSKFFSKKNILCSDIDEEAVKLAKKKGFISRNSNLFKNIEEKFDFIVFNAPYLPEDRHDKEKDTSGGRKGDEIILRFLRQVKSHISKDGKIFLLSSSLTPRERIKKELKNQELKVEEIVEKKLFFEKLEVWVISHVF